MAPGAAMRAGAYLALLAASGAQGAQPPTAPARPKLSPSDYAWTAFYESKLAAPWAPGKVTAYKFAYDVPNGAFYFGDVGTWSSGQLVRNSDTNQWERTMQGMCTPRDFEWEQAVYIYGFGWLADAAWMQSKELDGVHCDVWTLEKPNAYRWSACLTFDGVPLEYTVAADPREVGATSASWMSMVNLTLTNFSRVLDDADLQSSAACAHWPPPPCAEGSVQKVGIYRLCDECFGEPNEENAGDLVGEVFPICSSVFGGSLISGAKHLIAYDISVNTSYGPYQMMNWAPNKGHTISSKGVANLVGRSAIGTGCQDVGCGQCGENLGGSWFSFPEKGSCGGKAVGTEGCTWSVKAYSMKEITCVTPFIKDPCEIFASEAFKKTPDKDLIVAVFTNITKGLAVAMGSSSQGGCPDVPVLARNRAQLRAQEREEILVV